jgi:hypothetical protein
MLLYGSVEERVQAAHAVSRVGTPASALLPDLIEAFEGSQPKVKTAMARAIGAVGHGSAQARRVLQTALAAERDDAVLSALREALEVVVAGAGGSAQDGAAGSAGVGNNKALADAGRTPSGQTGAPSGGAVPGGWPGADPGAPPVDRILPGISSEAEICDVLGQPFAERPSGNMRVVDYVARDLGLADVTCWFDGRGMLQGSRLRLVRQLDPVTAAVVFGAMDEPVVRDGDPFGGRAEPGTRTHSYVADGVHLLDAGGVVKAVWLTIPYADANARRFHNTEGGR